MIYIAHRGNINGKQHDLENSPKYINRAIELGYHVEVDVWYNDGFFLGHDNPKYKINIEYLANDKLWCHAKNGAALYHMRLRKDIHSFWHETDDYTLTSRGFIWTYPKNKLYYNSICVLPEHGYRGNLNNCYAICSDLIEEYK